MNAVLLTLVIIVAIYLAWLHFNGEPLPLI